MNPIIDASIDSRVEQKKHKPKDLAHGEGAPVISGAIACILSIGLILLGIMGFAGTFSGTTYAWSIIGVSVAITFCSFGIMSPATIITIVLAILGMTGVLPFTAVGLGVMITIGIPLVCGIAMGIDSDK